MARLGVALLTLLGSFKTRRASAESFNIHTGIRDRVTSLSVPRVDELRFSSPFRAVAQPSLEDIELLDTVLVASVDGKFHAVNRSSGLVQWSMQSGPESDALLTTTPGTPGALAPLVRTKKAPFRGDDDDDDDDGETYIIEPQTGELFVMSSHGSREQPLHRLGVTMDQLVETSPVTLPAYGDGEKSRSFIGKKETALLTIDLRTGEIKSYVNSDEVCKWDGFESESSVVDDDFEPVTPQHSVLVSIGRTDYYVNVVVDGKSVQRLAYSVYGPNNIDRATQARWTQTPDDRYMQCDPDGRLYAFSTSPQSRDRGPRWALPRFDHPIAAIFDIVTVKGRSDPVALLQPKPRISDVVYDGKAADALFTKNMDKTYVGLVKDSLYAMSAHTYLLVPFVGEDRALDAVSDDAHFWHGGCESPKCLVGRWRTQDLSPDSRFERLLDPPQSTTETTQNTQSSQPETTQKTTPAVGTSAPVSTRTGPVNADDSGYNFFPTRSAKTYTSLAALGLAALIFIVARARPISLSIDAPFGRDGVQAPVQTAETPQAPTETVSLPVPGLSVATEPDAVAGAPALTVEPVAPPVDDGLDADEDDKDDGATPGKKRRRKRYRKPKGGKNNGGDGPSSESKDDADGLPVQPEVIEPDNIQLVLPPPSPSPATPRPLPASLVVSETVLGFGSHGTIVYQGEFQGRAVAVKRLLGDFVTLATREVQLLQESDDHPNVIRYFYKEQRDNFLYIALELCPASLADVVERPDAFRDISITFDPKKALAQVTAGLRHLHSLKIVHRDIKPQNILVSHAKNGVRRMLISDFGLCKKLDSDQTSFLPTMHGAMAAGTVGWRAPEILRGDVKLDDLDDSSRGSAAGSGSSPITGTVAKRLTKSVDVFALGCLFYYVLTNGDHPFGDRFERERNIMKNEFHLQDLERLGEEGVEAVDLISQMLDPEPKSRPDTLSILLHPFFWNPGRRLNFLQDASDRFEIMCRDPRDPALVELETGAFGVVGNDWHTRLDRIFIENLGKFRKYDGRTVQDLLRALRNKKHHYQDMPDNVKRHLGPLPEGFLSYFTRRFPSLFLHVHAVVSSTGLSREPMFRAYFELAES